MTTCASLEGVALCRSALGWEQVADFAPRIDAAYKPLEAIRNQSGTETPISLLPPGQRFVPRASSLSIGAALTDETVRALLTAISSGPIGQWIRNKLHDDIACDMDHAWIRRQYAPANYPPLHAPHGWHQDGALGFPFLSYPDGNYPPDSVLPMVTCWIPLVACGVDAPGLEFVMVPPERLFAPTDLTDERVRARFTSEEFWRPVLQPGDAVIFYGDILHRTHVSPLMTKDRASIELHFVPAHRIPVRLKQDRFEIL